MISNAQNKTDLDSMSWCCSFLVLGRKSGDQCYIEVRTERLIVVVVGFSSNPLFAPLAAGDMLFAMR